MAYERPDWNRLAEVHEIALSRAINYEFQYNENTDTYRFKTSGLHESEDYCGRQWGFDTAVDDVLDFLRQEGIWKKEK